MQNFQQPLSNDAKTKDNVTTFTATSNGKVYIAIPSGEASSHPDLTLKDDADPVNSILATTIVNASSPLFFGYHFIAVSGRTYTLSYIRTDIELVLTRLINDLMREEAQLSQKISNWESLINPLLDNLEFTSENVTNTSIKNWFKGTQIKGTSESLNNANSILSNQATNTHKSTVYGVIDQALQGSGSLYGILDYDNSDTVEGVSLPRNFLAYQKNNNKAEIILSRLLSGGTTDKNKRLSRSNGQGEGSSIQVNLGTDPYHNSESSIVYSRNIPKKNEIVKISVVAVINGNPEPLMTLNVPRNIREANKLTLRYAYNGLKRG